MLQSGSCQLRKIDFTGQRDGRMEKIADDNRRKEERFLVEDSLYVVIATEPETLGQVMEISSTGMAFTFVDIDDASLRLSKQSILHMDLFAGGRGVFIKDLACKLVSKIENASEPSPSTFSIKRVGVHFEELSLPQQIQINHLVRRQNLK
jgi:PilZ domain